MAKQNPNPDSRVATLGRDDLIRILGPIDDAKAAEILALKPTLAEVEQAAIWAAGNGDVLAKQGHPLTGIVADIFDALTAGEEEEPPPPR